MNNEQQPTMHESRTLTLTSTVTMRSVKKMENTTRPCTAHQPINTAFSQDDVISQLTQTAQLNK